jgi:hypothetical protein
MWGSDRFKTSPQLSFADPFERPFRYIKVVIPAQAGVT